ncbi:MULTISPECIES: transcription antitermination protein [Haloarcula]|uniref:transcription antitermination protein n=1 Tax=Haloarcula TaxID=2237 RepID=UPI0023EC7961|nr:transcription antitermination protein [Halomicroarcula sp. XH51]
MGPADTIETVRETTATELDRLGSDKLLIAVTGATLEPAAVRTAAATRERGLARTLERWGVETSETAVAGTFADAAADAVDRADRLDAEAEGDDALVAHLDTVAETPARVGAGLVAPPLLADRFYLQVVNFFLNEPDRASADRFREIRTGAADLDYPSAALESLSSEEREQAAAAAVDAIEAVYADYAETLEAMGLDPRPVC